MFHPKGPSLIELAEQALSSTDRGYDLLAPKFEYTPFRTPDALLQAVQPYIGEQGSIESGLDVCCGTGAAARMLHPLCRSRVVGVDRSEGMLAEAQRLSAKLPDEADITFLQEDALSLPFDQAFDVAVSFGAFGHILPKDEAAFVASIFRALKPGGRFVFVTGRMPPLTSRWYWAARGFNAVMRVRNAFISPPFIMYYLTFLWPDIKTKLEDVGFEVSVQEGLFESPFRRAILVTARRPANQ